MLKRLLFDEWLPDQPLTTGKAENVWPMPNGYRPVRSFGGITSALPGMIGGSAFIGSDGTSALLGGTATALHRGVAGAWTSVIGSLTANSWRFAQYGDLVIAVNGTAPIKYNIPLGTAADLGGGPPASDLVATVRDFVFLAGDPSNILTVTWSGFNDAEGWTPTVNQSGFQPLPDGGEVMGLAGGEYGIILQKNAIKRATYVGGDLVFQFDEISSNIGCMAKGSVAQAGKLIFFLSERGFMLCDGQTVTPLGVEKVDRTFFGTYSRQDIARISCAVDPQSTTVIWAMPGSPGRLWAYNWTLQRWSSIALASSAVFSGFSANVSLAELDVLYPLGLESIPYSLDDPIFAGGSPLFLVIRPDGVVGALSQANMAATLGSRPVEMAMGRRARVRRAAPVTDATQATVSVDARARAGNAPAVRVSGQMKANGSVALRANGMHLGAEIEIPEGVDWTYALGVDLEFEMEGAR